MTIIEILNGSDKDKIANIGLLAKDYLEKTGRKVCRTCPSDIQYMILTLKNIYNMTQFRFKKANVQYKNKKVDNFTISNSVMTDEKAVEFLKTDPKRIRLFSVFPSNWKKLVKDGLGSETEEEKAARLAAEAEAERVRIAEDRKVKLMKTPLKDLREKYPDIKATSIEAFVDKVIAQTAE